ncbi:DNA protecting protein DprA [Marinobacter salarius]|jgi:DNA processing protein|uniref:DNA protecting protein DprA n=1 Tax=Marinobacter salarius TaxID=1420917 RepID=A0ABY1FQS9_9GAMM|nr:MULTISPECIES: DNA-processing protein DprA [Marinobacter]KXJ43481.1 MAG: DNA processing protein DprA [Marinobacter sp. Hex_13]MBS8231546.1 DNA-protecting protein DprA [Marinobacter salarius]SFL87449.1 DNA protecting protein DprA [Marinobacter salarius]|tara:strand:- start:951 stop:2117 length:1167 start_codon:yes stop_codon:yes gene_type:complete
MSLSTDTLSARNLFQSEHGFWIFLSCLPKFGARRQQAILEQIPDFQQLLTHNAATLKALGLAAETIDALQAWRRQDSAHPVIASADGIYRDCLRTGTAILTIADADYPEPLRHIHDGPLVLYVRGDRSLLGREQIGIVGSRNATRAGLEHARSFAAALGQKGLLVTSGLALGVDGAAHAGALDAGFPTVAVIGNGVDKPYPYRHRTLSERIAGEGVIVSEYPPGTSAKAGHFPRRNRIISGLSRGILVVEAGLKSGSLITARLALEQGREVFAIPGSVHNPLARGCHHLIRQGAKLVETVDDICEELGGWWTSQNEGDSSSVIMKRPATEGLDSREIAVLEALGYDPQSTDDLCSVTGLPADQLMQSLLLLELQGLVDSAPGGFQRIG